MTRHTSMAAGALPGNAETSSPPATTGNRLLDALCRERPSLRSKLQPLAATVGDTLFEAGDTLDNVYFPVDGVLSILLTSREGQTAEAFTVGNEGVVGLPVYLGLKTAPYRVVPQLAGLILRVSAAQFCAQIAGSRNASSVLKRFTAFSLQFSYQTCVCNLYHTVEQRACRWLLTTAERRGENTLRLTHRHLSEMLGVRRQSVGDVAVRLQSRGLIRYSRGVVALADRRALEARACSCYATMRDCYASVVGPLV